MLLEIIKLLDRDIYILRQDEAPYKQFGVYKTRRSALNNLTRMVKAIKTDYGLKFGDIITHINTDTIPIKRDYFKRDHL